MSTPNATLPYVSNQSTQISDYWDNDLNCIYLNDAPVPISLHKRHTNKGYSFRHCPLDFALDNTFPALHSIRI